MFSHVLKHGLSIANSLFPSRNARLNLPASCRGEKDLPGLLITANTLIGEKSHDRLLRTDFDYIELSYRTGMGQGRPPRIAGDLDARLRIFDELL